MKTFLFPLYPGDIVGISRSPSGGGPMRLLMVEMIDETDGQACGFSVESDGRPIRGLWVFPQWQDQLVACGRDEDCRRHIDLAMACAEQRRAAGPISDERGGK